MFLMYKTKIKNVIQINNLLIKTTKIISSLVIFHFYIMIIHCAHTKGLNTIISDYYGTLDF